jgi:hypothetical protein
MKNLPWQGDFRSGLESCPQHQYSAEERSLSAEEEESMKRYWVVGGEYADTSFTRFAPGKAEERLGPFASYETALRAWSGRAWATVDDAHMRFSILTEEDSAAPRTRYWVVGGEYADATFTVPAAGKKLERLGPFATPEEAQKAWAGRAWATVDDAMCRYRIEIEQLAPGEQ